VRLVARDVVVRYRGGDRDVLDGASFEVRRGEAVAILGPSGSGKSTLLGVLGGLVRPTSGTVVVDRDRGAPGPGAAAAAAAGRALRPADVSAWVLQTTNVLPERSALDNVAVAARTQGLSGPQARRHAAQRLADVGLAERAHACARVLSGGEVQRVVIARALASGRPFVLADEPTGQLDRSTSAAVLDALLTTSAEAGVVVVTHDPEVAERCDRTVRIRDGRAERA